MRLRCFLSGAGSTLGLFALIITTLVTEADCQVQMAFNKVFTTDGRVNNQVEAGIGDRVRVEVDKLKDAVEQKQVDPYKLVLYLDGLELKGLYGTPIDIPAGILEYKLERTENSKPAWNTLLGSSKSAFREVMVSIGPENGQSIPAFNAPPTMKLRLFYRWWFYVVTIAFVLGMIWFLYRAKNTNILRDTNPPFPPAGKMKPYSLGRVQMAFWFFLVIGSFIYIYLITGDYNTISDQALILIGIGTGTALGAAAIDANKSTTADNELYTLLPERERLNAEINQLSTKQKTLSSNVTRTPQEEIELGNINVELPKKEEELAQRDKKINDIKSTLEQPVSEGPMTDLLSDAYGISFHRFQIVVWTIVLGVLFIVGVYKALAMPEFSTTLLALMGISSGTYLGFKIPERQTERPA